MQGSSKLQIGVLGAGEMGRLHAENLRRLVPRANVAAIADVNGPRAAEVAAQLEISHAYDSLEAMLEQKDLQAIVVATPDKFHPEAVQAAARAGKDVFCEKPLGLNTASANAALAAVNEAGVRLQMGFMRRYDPAHVSARKMVEAGEIGEPVIFKSLGRDKEMPTLASYQSGVNGMVFYNSAIHDFDSARWLTMDEVAEVHSFGTVHTRPEVAQFCDVVASTVNLRFDKGAIGNVETYVQALYGYDVRTEIVGSEGSILIGGLQEHTATFLKGGRGSYRLADYFLGRFREAYVEEMLDFTETILSDRLPRVSGEDGLRAVAIAAAAEESLATKRVCAVETSIRGHQIV